MPHAEMKNAPPLYGWAIAVAAGAVAAAVSYLIVGIEGNGSVGVGAVITLVVGIIFNLAETPPAARASAPAAPAPKAAAPVAPAAPAPAAPAAASAPAETVAEGPAADAGTQPAALSGPKGTADDLKLISGVGPVLEGKLNDLGIYHFWQIAGWSADEVTWVDGFLNFKGRIGRDDWVAQAKELAKTSPAS